MNQVRKKVRQQLVHMRLASVARILRNLHRSLPSYNFVPLFIFRKQSHTCANSNCDTKSNIEIVHINTSSPARPRQVWVCVMSRCTQNRNRRGGGKGEQNSRSLLRLIQSAIGRGGWLREKEKVRRRANECHTEQDHDLFCTCVCVCTRELKHLWIRECAVDVVVAVHLPYLYSVLIITHLSVPLNTHTPWMNDWLTDPIILAYSLRWYAGTHFSIQYATPSSPCWNCGMLCAFTCKVHNLLLFVDDYLFLLSF